MKKKRKLGRNLLSFLLTLAMVFSTMTGIVPFMDTSMTVKAEVADKTIAGLGTSAIGNPTSTESTATAWAGSYVYYGKYDGENPTKYRVLDTASADFGVEGGSLLLDCDKILYASAFYNNNSNVWSSSLLIRSGLQGDDFLNKQDVFTVLEKSAIASSTKASSVEKDGAGASFLKYVALDSDTVFILDAKEASRASYGYASNGTRIKDGNTNGWWLRSTQDGNVTGYVYSTDGYYGPAGTISSGNGGITRSVSPAFNIGLSSVIFASEISSEPGSYKLTLKDDALGIAVTEGEKVEKSGNTLTIPYTVSGENSANATQVSVLVTGDSILDESGNIIPAKMTATNKKAYGKLVTEGSFAKSGTGTFELPSDLTGTIGTDYHVYLLAEDVNGEKETDYANLKEITADDISTGPDKTALNNAITAAETLYNSINDNDDYTDIASTLKTAIDAAKEVADSDEADQDNINAAATAIITAKTKAVIGMIDKLPATVTAEDKEKIEAVRAAYDSLSDTEKTSVTNSSKLTEAETALKTAIKNELETAIAEAETYHESIKDSNPEDAAALLEAINAAKVVKENTGATQTEMENAITALAGAKETAEKAVKVNELGTAIDDADEYYNSIKEKDPDAATMLLKAINAAKEVKSNADATKEEIENITAALADAKVVAETVVAINALPTFSNVTADNKTAIEAARAAYDALTDDQKAKVSADTLKKLTDAEDKLVILQTMSEVSAKTGSGMTYTGNPIQLINTPTTKLPAGYKMVYAVTSENKAPTDEKLYTTDIPTETDAGTYYVWYKVVGNENYNDCEAVCVKVTIEEEKKQDEPETPEKPEEPVTPDIPVKTVDMYRLYNPNSGEHFYTANVTEKDNLVKLGWRYEGIGWKAPVKSNTPVYRLYNPNAGDHHYTRSIDERDYLVSLGWKYEGIGWYSDDAESVPLYRQYNPNAKAGNHNYTASKSENDWLVSLGWKGEGIGWYGVK